MYIFRHIEFNWDYSRKVYINKYQASYFSWSWGINLGTPWFSSVFRNLLHHIQFFLQLTFPSSASVTDWRGLWIGYFPSFQLETNCSWQGLGGRWATLPFTSSLTQGKIHEISYVIYLLKNFPSAIPAIWFMFFFWIGAFTVQHCLCWKAVTGVLWECKQARVGETVHLWVRTWRAECDFCVCRCLRSLRHEDQCT